jgi:asparagine synthase (glutamine-hydrolysing)
MCGIVGFWQPAGLASDARHILARMMTRIHHRGPDGSGHHIDEQRGLAMGHTRLAIIDLSKTGVQPIVDPRKQLVLTINGELYDYKLHRATLSCAGERFITKTDSEIALKLYHRYGLDFASKLRGEFAIALFDEKQKRLVLVRDRFGVRPLFYRIDGNQFFYGSEIKSLFAHPAVPRKLDVKAAVNQMMHTMVPGTTAFEGVSALEPGHLLVVEQVGETLQVKKQCYWDMTFPLEGEHDPDPDKDAYVAGVAEQLIDAVRVRLEADVPVGCYLSGGIDSCSILGLSTAMQQSAVKAFTISFDHDAYDEAAIANEMASTTSADQELLLLAAAELYGDSYVKTAWHSERTFYNTLGVAKWHMSKRVRECGFKVVVTGEGSDELFGGYPALKRDYFLHGKDLGPKGAQLMAEMDAQNKVFKGAILSETLSSHPAFDQLCGFTPSWLQPWLLVLDQVRPLFSESARQEIGDYDPVAAIAAAIDPERVAGRHPLDIAQYTWSKTMLEGQILNWGGDRVDMANSMESRPPFLDHLLADYAVRIPPSLRIHEGVEKWVLREAMKGVLPELLYKRQKFAFMAPPAYTDTRKQRAIDELIATHLGRDQVEALGFFDWKKVEQFVSGYQNPVDSVSGARGDIILNHLLCMHLMHQQLVCG